jgi:hypothetical protein
VEITISPFRYEFFPIQKIRWKNLEAENILSLTEETPHRLVDSQVLQWKIQEMVNFSKDFIRIEFQKMCARKTAYPKRLSIIKFHQIKIVKNIRSIFNLLPWKSFNFCSDTGLHLRKLLITSEYNFVNNFNKLDNIAKCK